MIRYLIGDVFEKMAELEDGSVDLILTSPPFLALRSYLPADHPDKEKEIGSEATPAEFIETLLALTAEWRRLLAPHGTLAVELGDSYAGSGGVGGDYFAGGWSEGQEPFKGTAKHARIHDPEVGPAIQNKNGKTQGGGPGWPLAKSLTLVPESYRFALAYGINPHTGQPSPAGQWRIRNVVRWVRPNPPVGALGDKFRPATSELVVACVSKDRWFDLDAVREPLKHPHQKATLSTTRPAGDPYDPSIHSPAGAPPLDWWKISPKGYAGAHYAVWPAELCVKPVKAMCPEWVCRECGEPRRRIVGDPEYVHDSGAKRQGDRVKGWTNNDWGANSSKGLRERGHITRTVETLGFTDCGHDNYRRGIVLDPFAGTGTTLAVAHGHGRDAIGIDLDSRNADLALERVGPLFMEVE